MPHFEKLFQGSIEPKWAIVIPTFNRYERFFTALYCLNAAVKFLGKRVEIFIMDNSPKPVLKKYLCKCSVSTLIRMYYSHLPELNQSELRNTAVNRLSKSVENILIMDSDIYLSSSTLAVLERCLEENSELEALAPPMASYKGGKHADGRKKVHLATGGGLIMPSPYDYSQGKINGNVMETLLLRGAFCLRKRLLNQLGTSPWLPIFKVWQNVPFFISLREKGKRFGYILDTDALVLHDDRPHSHTLRSSESQWHAQTLKSLILLFFRNQLWKEEQKTLNRGFFERITPVIKQHSDRNNQQTVDLMLEAAKVLEAKSVMLLNDLAKSIKYNCADTHLEEALHLLTECSWEEIEAVKSFDLNVRI